MMISRLQISVVYWVLCQSDTSCFLLLERSEIALFTVGQGLKINMRAIPPIARGSGAAKVRYRQAEEEASLFVYLCVVLIRDIWGS